MPYNEFIRFTEGGLSVLTFTEIRDQITQMYRDTYGIGEDIDLSTATADGVFINNVSLIINNICQTMVSGWNNFDVSNASGIYLDTLCRLSNVVRKDATSSTAVLTLTAGSSAATIANGSKFIDKAGTTWTYNGNTLSLQAGSSQSISVTCDIPGYVEAPVGWIYARPRS